MTNEDYQMLRDYCGENKNVYIVGNELDGYPMTEERRSLYDHLLEKYESKVVKMNVITNIKRGQVTLVLYYVPRKDTEVRNAVVANEEVIADAVKDLHMNLSLLKLNNQIFAKPYSSLYPYAVRNILDKRNLYDSIKEAAHQGMTMKDYDNLIEYCGSGSGLYLISQELGNYPMTETREWLFNLINKDYQEYCLKAIVSTPCNSEGIYMVFQRMCKAGEKFKAYVLNEAVLKLILEEHGMDMTMLVENKDYFKRTYDWLVYRRDCIVDRYDERTRADMERVHERLFAKKKAIRKKVTKKEL